MARVLSGRRTRWLLSVLALAVLAYGVLSYFPGVDYQAPATQVDGPSLRTVPIRDRAELDRLIALFESRVLDHTDPLDYRQLGLLYGSRARLDGDTADYLHAEEAIRAALDLYPDDVLTQVRRTETSLALHEFEQALDLSTELLQRFPTHSPALAVQTDALIALGRYEPAKSRLEMLERLAGDHPAVMARRSQLDWILGDTEGSLANARAAVDRAAQLDFPSLEVAWYRTFLGDRLMSIGRLSQAETLYLGALTLDPSAVHALHGLGQIRAAQGQIDAAIELYIEAISRMPSPELVAELGDLYAAFGRPDLAEEQYRLVPDLLSGIANVDRASLAAFFADHRQNISEAVSLTLTELELRQDVGTLDAHAWALYQAGDYQQARSFSDRALGVGTRDAELWYHAGLISLALGETGRGHRELSEALSLNPYFDVLQGPHARALLTTPPAG